MLINAEEIVLAVPEVSDSCAGGIPGHTVGVRQGIFPPSPPRSRLGIDPRVSRQGSSQEAASGTQEMPEELSTDRPQPSSPRAGRNPAAWNLGII